MRPITIVYRDGMHKIINLNNICNITKYSNKITFYYNVPFGCISIFLGIGNGEQSWKSEILEFNNENEAKHNFALIEKAMGSVELK